MLDNGPGMGGKNDTDFLMRLGATRKHQTATFESKTQREVFADVRRRENDPGESSLLYL